MYDEMVLELCGGTPSEITVAGNPHAPKRVVDFPSSDVKRLTGMDVRRRKAGAYWRGSALPSTGDGVTKVTVPSWRPDVEGKADIVEEVMRILGVDRVPSTPFARGEAARKPVLTPMQPRTRKAKRALAGRGMAEAVTWSFVAGTGGNVRRRRARVGARQSDRGGALRHAAEPHSGTRACGAEKCRPRIPRCRAVRGRADIRRR